VAPTKAFNLAGLQTASVIVPNEMLRNKVWRGLNTDEVAEPNAFAVDVTIAAFTKGEIWLDELRGYIFENKKVVTQFIKAEVSDIKVIPSEATYLLWLDCGNITSCAQKLADFLREKTGLYLSSGSQYGKAGDMFLRMNIACPRETLLDGLERLKRGLSL
jgi:cystathionine beta-lyase